MIPQESSLAEDFEGIGHRPVLLREVLELLAPRAGQTIVDGTVGAGGHASELLRAIGKDGRLIIVDRDAAALALARERLAKLGGRVVAVHGRHEELATLLEEQGVEHVDGILLDLGVSSMQLDDPSRGFSFRHDGPLDMRMNPQAGRSAAEILADLDEAELRRILWRFGEERHSRAIARAITGALERGPITTTLELAAIVERAVPSSRGGRVHPATRTFQALRIVVNDELEHLQRALTDAIGLLAPGGRLAVISFHSLEDRIVKRVLRAEAPHCRCPPGLPVCVCGTPGRVEPLTSRPRRPSTDEVASNPRSRSARLRAAEKL